MVFQSSPSLKETGSLIVPQGRVEESLNDNRLPPSYDLKSKSRNPNLMKIPMYYDTKCFIMVEVTTNGNVALGVLSTFLLL